MNRRMLFYMMGWLFRLEGMFLMLPFLTALCYRESAARSYLCISLWLTILGFLFAPKKPERQEFFAKDGFVLVSLSWIVLSFFGALPFYMSGEIPCFTDAMFEMVSGFTTTGASILPSVESISHASRVWRSFSHWVGGMGILVFMLAVLPMTGENTMCIMRAESPGPSVGKLVPRIRTTALLLYRIYLVMTVLMFLVLMLTGMPLFDSICMTLGTAGTGGFSCRDSAQTGYTMLQQGVIGVFMVLFGINFNVFYLLLVRKYREAFSCEEMRGYLVVIAAAVLLIVLNIRGRFATFPEALHQTAFTVASIITTTGYMTVDFNQWPEFSKSILLALMLVGGCAGSTAGGMKVSRIMIALKEVGKEIGAVVHPRRVKVLQFEGKAIGHEILRSLNAFVLLYIVILAVSIILISIDGYDLMTTASSAFTALNNVGPGLGLAGPAENFSFYSHFSKWVLIFDMLAGRLELFPVFVLLSPATWRKN